MNTKLKRTDDYVISADSTADLTKEEENKLGVKVVHMEVTFNGDVYCKDSDIKNEKFYKDIKNGLIPKTTQITSSRFKEHFESFLKAKTSVLHISFSSGLSGTYNQALIAADELNEKYKDCKVLVLDSLCASVGEGLLVHYACMKKKQENLSLDDLFNWVNKIKLNIHHIFTVDDLFYLRRGGRISTTEAVFGSVLSVKPIIEIDKISKLYIAAKVRGIRASIDYIVKNMEQCFTPSKDFGRAIVAHTLNVEGACMLKKMINQRLNVTDISVKYIGPCVGTHLGAGTIAAAFYGNVREK